MRGLFTADWQAEWANLRICSRVWKWALELCRQERLEFICIAGDLKRAYNPVDMRVNLWWQDAVERAVAENIRVIINNGNHDRIGQTDDQQNWLPLLERAGAEVFDEPKWVKVQEGYLWMLPYCSSTKKLLQNSEYLARANKPGGTNVLVFHTDLKHARYNVTGEKSDAGVSVRDLHPDRYTYCLGGHIHLAQQLDENVFYLGSPFATDWGEANQEKSVLIVDGDHLHEIPSPIPGWYDDTWPGFPKQKKQWKGTNLRLHVRIDAKTAYSGALRRAREEAERKYPGAILHTVADFEEREQVDVKVRMTDPDWIKIKTYVRAQKYEDERRMIQYLVRKLEKVGGTKRAVSPVRFLNGSAKNFLSWKELDIKYEPGLTVVAGRNGMGKTNLLQPIPVALFGETFKGQKHDAWARRHSQERAEVEILCKDSRQRDIRITRSRRPVGIRLSIQGVDHSSGLRGDAKDATQGFIEQVTGFTWETLGNAVYIDQEVTRAFMTGTKKQRTELLSRFQNLERFEKTLKWIRQDKNANHQSLLDTQSECEQAKRLVTLTLFEVMKLDKQHKQDLADLKVGLKRIERELDKARETLETNERVRNEQVKKWRVKVHSLNHMISAINEKIGAEKYKKQELEGYLSNMAMLGKRVGSNHATCPLCWQKLSEEGIAGLTRKWKKQLEEVSQTYSENLKERTKLMASNLLLERKIEELEGETIDEKQTISQLETQLRFEMEKLRAFHNAELREESERNKKKLELRKAERKVVVLEQSLKQQTADQEFYQFAEMAMGRDGIPAFLNRALVPVLNKAADEYAELFTAKELQVRFGWDGEFTIDIINAQGGEDFKAQSLGEKALVGLIGAFAAREATLKSNVLVLDEPGAGLDERNARIFARALRKLVGRSESVFVITHNQNILAELDGERTLTVTKRNGVSAVTTV